MFVEIHSLSEAMDDEIVKALEAGVFTLDEVLGESDLSGAGDFRLTSPGSREPRVPNGAIGERVGAVVTELASPMEWHGTTRDLHEFAQRANLPGVAPPTVRGLTHSLQAQVGLLRAKGIEVQITPDPNSKYMRVRITRRAE